MVMKERGIAHKRAREESGHRTHEAEWRVPRGRDIDEIARDATDQVVIRYREALEKLKKS